MNIYQKIINVIWKYVVIVYVIIHQNIINTSHKIKRINSIKNNNNQIEKENCK